MSTDDLRCRYDRETGEYLTPSGEKCGGQLTKETLVSDETRQGGDSDDLDGAARGTVADAVDFARECSEDWGLRVAARVEARRADLPPIVERRTDHDGPLWIIRPADDPTHPGLPAHPTGTPAGDEGVSGGE